MTGYLKHPKPVTETEYPGYRFFPTGFPFVFTPLLTILPRPLDNHQILFISNEIKGIHLVHLRE